ncbi:c-type cytochrome domain-containing protein [Verrucomicrobium spinosum]|uniref:c-type cytochrome domain-containing protein n=1 Tax=Verrucomicrobium spinosum TaxID=2736 RepID=UPI00094642DA|nr:c-type cytochrome domain-containing protein [Verrucomicrobium spinosum]
MRSNCFIRVLGPGILVALLSALSAVANDVGGTTFFENEVRPLLVKYCYECHSQESGKAKGGLLLDRREGWAMGGDAGPAVVPGKVAESLLIASVRYEKPDLQMPPKSRLNAGEVAVLERWVAMGPRIHEKLHSRPPRKRSRSTSLPPARRGPIVSTMRHRWRCLPLNRRTGLGKKWTTSSWPAWRRQGINLPQMHRPGPGAPAVL